VGTDYTRRAGHAIFGRDGLSLSDKWKSGLRTMHGMHSRGFPNLLIMGPQQSAFTVNYPHALDEQSKHIAYIVGQVRERGIRTLEASEAAEQEWVDTIISLARLGRDFLESCTPGYYNNEGNLSNLSAQNGFFGAGSIVFFQLLKDWREKGDLPGLELS
jgi:cyclohexanone monooxygenase